MTIYKGTIRADQFYNKICELLIAEGYQDVTINQSNEGRVFYTQGMSGKDTFYIQLYKAYTGSINIGVYEGYNNDGTGKGAFQNGNQYVYINWMADTSTQESTYSVKYVINVNKDRLLVYVEGLYPNSNKMVSLTYAGLPKRYDPKDLSGYAAFVAGTSTIKSQTHHNTKLIRDRSLAKNVEYLATAMDLGAQPGWTNKLFRSPLYLYHRTNGAFEGLRGELEGIFYVPKNDAVNGDIVTENGKQYMLVKPSFNSYTTGILYGQWLYAIEI